MWKFHSKETSLDGYYGLRFGVAVFPRNYFLLFLACLRFDGHGGKFSFEYVWRYDMGKSKNHIAQGLLWGIFKVSYLLTGDSGWYFDGICPRFHQTIAPIDIRKEDGCCTFLMCDNRCADS